ncbi:MAG: helix-turn-helix transcriptional regulator [Gemmatimonadota bacterium]
MSEITWSSGNVFQDLGFSPEEAANLKVRSSLMGSIRRITDERGLKQAEAAELFGVTQPRISDLMRGKIELFSIDALINMLAHAGHDVEVSVEPRAA